MGRFVMTDRHTPEQRSRNMSAVRSKDSAIELRLRRALWVDGLRYRKHYGKLPGRPDIVFVAPRVVVFCDSEFWHGYDWERRQHDIGSNREFWIPKIERNIARDLEVNERLTEMGWRVLRFWGHQIEDNLEDCVANIREAVKGSLKQ